jgi:hypothetical protein
MSKKREKKIGPRAWKKTELISAGEPVAQALKEIFEESFPPFEIIRYRIAAGKDHIKEVLKSAMGEIISLDMPRRFDERANVIVDDDRFSGSFDMSRLELVPVLNGEGKIPGMELAKRAREMGIYFGRHHGQYFIDHWWEMPEDMVAFLWKMKEDEIRVEIALPGTLWMHPGGGLFVESISFQNPWPTPYASTGLRIDERREFGSNCYFLKLRNS